MANDLVVYQSRAERQQHFEQKVVKKSKSLYDILATLGEEYEYRMRGWWFFGPRYSFDFGNFQIRCEFDTEYQLSRIYEIRVKGLKKGKIDLDGAKTPQIFTDRILTFRTRRRYGADTKAEFHLNQMEKTLEILKSAGPELAAFDQA